MSSTPNAGVFDAVDRTDPSPSKHSESTAAFLDRVAGRYWDEIRELINAWALNVPSAERPDLVGRLRSRDDRQFAGVFWELYLHETFRRCGFEVTIHPSVDGGNRKPDFLVTTPVSAFYVEAKALVGRAPEPGAVARKMRLYDALDHLRCPNFFLKIDVNAVGPNDLPARALRKKLAAWLDGLDPDSTPIALDDDDPQANPFRWQHAGWDLAFYPVPKSLDARGEPGLRTLGIFGPIEAVLVSDDVELRNALTDKGSAYGDLEHPLVIAVNVFGFSHDNFDTMNALYGTYQLQVSLVDRDAAAVPTRAPDGYWAAGSWAHHHVAGVLIARSMAPWRVTEEAPTFWPHPEPGASVTPVPAWRIAEPIVDHIEYLEPESSLAELFGLPDPWPSSPDPWEEHRNNRKESDCV